MEDILSLFFSRVHVHYIPMEGLESLGSADRILTQNEALYRRITSDVKYVQSNRSRSWMRLDSNQMPVLFEYVFKHLASGSKTAFDFSLCRRQISLPSSVQEYIRTFLEMSLFGDRVEKNFFYAASVIASGLVIHVLKSDGPGKYF
jgi:hypothetical protein